MMSGHVAKPGNFGVQLVCKSIFPYAAIEGEASVGCIQAIAFHRKCSFVKY